VEEVRALMSPSSYRDVLSQSLRLLIKKLNIQQQKHISTSKPKDTITQHKQKLNPRLGCLVLHLVWKRNAPIVTTVVAIKLLGKLTELNKHFTQHR